MEDDLDREICLECSWWVGGQGWEIEDEENNNGAMIPAGECRRLAPIKSETGFVGEWPLTKFNDYCGLHSKLLNTCPDIKTSQKGNS